MNERTVRSGYRMKYRIAYDTRIKYTYAVADGYILFMGRALEFTLSLSRLRRVFPDTVNNKESTSATAASAAANCVLHIYRSHLLTSHRELDIYFLRIELWTIFCVHFVHTLLHGAFRLKLTLASTTRLKKKTTHAIYVYMCAFLYAYTCKK